MEWRDRRVSNMDDKSVVSKEELEGDVLRESLNSVLSLLYWSFDVRETYARPGKSVVVRATIAGPNLVDWIILGEGSSMLTGRVESSNASSRYYSKQTTQNNVHNGKRRGDRGYLMEDFMGLWWRKYYSS